MSSLCNRSRSICAMLNADLCWSIFGSSGQLYNIFIIYVSHFYYIMTIIFSKFSRDILLQFPSVPWNDAP